MLFHYLKVKSTLTHTKISSYCSIFFRKLNIDSKYICVQVKIRDVNGQTYNIGKNYNVDISNRRNISSFKTQIIDDYEDFLLTGNKAKISRFIFEYKPLSTMDLIQINNKKINKF